MIIGLIGGVTANAAAHIYEKICEIHRESTNEFPEIIIHSIKCSQEDENRFMNQKDEDIINVFKERIKRSCEIFKKSKVSTAVICCNTLSDLFENVAKEFEFEKILTPINCSRKKLLELNKRKPLILGTKYTINKELISKDGITQTQLSEDEKNNIQEFISSKINSEEKDEDALSIIIKEHSNEVDSIVISCTDLTKETITEKTSLEVIDSTEELIKCCINALR